MLTQELKHTDYARRLNFAQKMKRKLESGEIMRNMLLISDEAHFDFNESVNKQNCQYYGTNNPHLIHKKPLHAKCVTVWCGVVEWGIVSPYFFHKTINAERYTKLLDEFLMLELKQWCKLSFIFFQQDGATCHTVKKKWWHYCNVCSVRVSSLALQTSVGRLTRPIYPHMRLFSLGIPEVAGVCFEATHVGCVRE